MTKNALNAAAVAVMALVLACLGLIFWAGDQRNAIIGPAALSIDAQQRLWLLADRQLFILDSAGTLLSQSGLTALGMDDSVVALATLPGGGAVAGSRERGVLFVLGADGRVLRTIDPSTTAVRHLRDGVALGAAGDRILVAHTGHHRLLLLDASGAVIRQVGSMDGEPGAFHFPNDIRVGPDGMIYVANTNHHDIQVLDGDLRSVRRIPVPRTRGASWPVAVAPLPSGKLAVSVLQDGMRHGVAVLLAADGSLDRTLEFQVGAEPLCLLARSDDLLACDRHSARFQVRRFDHQGTFVGEFGDAAFVAAMQDAASRHRRYDNLRLGGQGGAILAALLLLVIYQRSRSLEGAAREAALRLPEAAAVSWREQLRFQFAMTWPMLIVVALLLGVEMLDLPPEAGIAVYALLLLVLFWALRLGFRNVQKPEFVAAIRAQAAQTARWRLKSLAWWSADEPVLAAGRAYYQGGATLVLVSPVRIVILSVLGGSVIENIPIQSVSAALPCAAHWGQRLLAGDAARGLILHLQEPAPRSLTLSFAFGVEQGWIAQGIQDALARPGATKAPAPVTTVPSAGPRRPAWSSVLLSALLPGLGHFNQQRHAQGAAWVVSFGALAVVNALAWFVYVKRIAEVEQWGLLATSALLGLLWLAALSDVWSHERQLRTHAAEHHGP